MMHRSNHPPARRHRRRGAIAAALAFGLLAAACGGSDDDADGSSAATADQSEPETSVGESTAGSETASTSGEASATASGEAPAERKGGSVTVAMNGQPVTLDPSLQVTSFSYGVSAVASAVFGHLAYADPATGQVVLYFLESLEGNEDGSVWTMKVHPNIKFSDGTPLDAEAIKYNIERSADPATGSRFQKAAAGITFNVIDELTLEATLPAPNKFWDTAVVANFAGIGSPTAIQAALDAGEEPGATPVGAGPFVVKEWDPGQRMVLERNPYFEEFKPGEPYLDELIFQQADEQQRLDALVSGAAQLVLTYGGLATNNLVEAANAVFTSQGGANSISLNTKIPPFDDVRARQALSMALDRTVIGNAVNPDSPVATSLFPETSPFYNPDYVLPSQNKEEAQRLFDELAAEGKPVDFSYTTNDSPIQQDVINALIAQLAEYDNVTFTPIQMTQTDYIAATQANRDFQSTASCVCFTATLPLLYQYVYPGEVENYSQWENADVKTALDGLNEVETIEDQKAIWDVVQRELIEEVPVIFVTSVLSTVGYSDDMIVPQQVNLGTYPLWAQIGYK